MERGHFPDNALFGNFIAKSVNELVNKPLYHKNPVEQLLDTYYAEYLPKGFINFTLDKNEENDDEIVVKIPKKDTVEDNE